MKLIALIGIVALAIGASDAAVRNRAKRFAGFGAISTVGGRVGCVVSENGPGNASLYINSHFTKFLSPEEQAELAQYKTQLIQYKEDVKAFVEERRKAVAAQQQRAFGGPRVVGATGAPSQDLTTVAGSAKQPESPKKPSFCSEKDVTQYVFDGCSVQGDSVYIGENFVRKLTPAEQERLVEFDEQFTAYQDSVRQQMEQIFGKTFGALFESAAGGGVSAGAGIGQPKSSEDVASGAVRHKTAKGGRVGGPAAEAGIQHDAPKAPDFCTLIV